MIGTKAIFQLWGSSANDIWAVGQSGTALHFDGSAWSPKKTGANEGLTGVWGTGSQVWVVGQRGAILHKK